MAVRASNYSTSRILSNFRYTMALDRMVRVKRGLGVCIVRTLRKWQSGVKRYVRERWNSILRWPRLVLMKCVFVSSGSSTVEISCCIDSMIFYDMFVVLSIMTHDLIIIRIYIYIYNSSYFIAFFKSFALKIPWGYPGPPCYKEPSVPASRPSPDFGSGSLGRKSRSGSQMRWGFFFEGFFLRRV